MTGRSAKQILRFAQYDKKCSVLFLSYYRKSVTQWQNHHLNPLVIAYQVIERPHSVSLCILSRGVNHMPVPQGVVGQNPTAIVQVFHCHLVILYVLALVAVHEHQVELLAQCGHNLKCIADDELNLVGIG